MSTMRGLIPSLGAGGSLIGAALCALVVLGGVLAFRGEVPGTAEADTGELKMPPGQVRAATDPAPRRAAVAPAPAAAGSRVVVAAAGSRRGATVSTTGSRAVPRLTAPTRTTPATPSEPQPTIPSEPRPAARSKPAAPAPVEPPAPPAIVPPGTVQRTVARTRAATQPVVDAAPAPLQAPVEHVADTVERVATTVDGLTGPLLP